MCQYLLGLIWLLPVMLASVIHFKDCPQERPFNSNPICPIPDLHVRWREVEPWLTRIDAGEIGDVKILNLTKGRTHRRITLAQKPALFEVPGFLSDAECKYIIRKAKTAGLDYSGVIGYGSDAFPDPSEEQELSEITRVSYSVYLEKEDDKILNMIKKRIARVTELPTNVVLYNEPVQVAKYMPQGHYHAHPDSSDDWTYDDSTTTLPCCYQFDQEVSLARCLLCRFLTFMIYLNDVEEGGETSFPYAHTQYHELPEYLQLPSMPLEALPDVENLSTHCYKGKLHIRPKKGTAVFWYNHFLDPETGWLGKLDHTSLHGGCDVIRGEKWITNFWLNVPNRYNNNLPRY